MIQINLLPPNELKTVRMQQRRIPIIPFLLVLFFILLLYWVVVMLSVAHLKGEIYSRALEMEEVKEKKNDVDDVWDALNNTLLKQKESISEVMLRHIEWAYVLNVVSDFTTQGIWLTQFSLEQKDGVWLLSLSGFAKPITGRSMIKDIGIYVSNIKDAIEGHVLKEIASEEDLQDRVTETTKTKRKKAMNIELMEFTTLFKVDV